MRKALVIYLSIGCQLLAAQNTITKRDTLQGGARPERSCFDVLHYDLNLTVNPKEKFISGYNEITFKAVENTTRIQLDLFENMQIDSIVYNKERLSYKREFAAVFVDFNNPLIKNSEQRLRFYYSGHPTEAMNAPWDGGFVWRKDANGKDWVGVAVQEIGASLWYPVKDTQSDEPDNGATIKIAVPNGLMDVSNGRFLGSEDLKNGYTRWGWEVKNPINSYDITVNIGDYVHFGENYKGLDLDYYVLPYNLSKAQKQFEQVKPMMDCFQAKFGTYPFQNDGYKLVETPYLGMEHQSAVAYGNKYLPGYAGSDLSQTGIGLLFDFIIIHESAHEWFGNSITSKDIADMWIHEAFATYAESVFVECQFGREKASKYINGLAVQVANDKPIIGKYGLNQSGSGDMYFKGALMLNTIRHVIDNDDKWWKILYSFCITYRHKIIDTETVVTFFNKASGIDLTYVFNQYLRHTNIPVLELRKKGNKLEYRWQTDEVSFEMPIDIKLNGKKIRLYPGSDFKVSKFKIESLKEIKVLTGEYFINVRLF